MSFKQLTCTNPHSAVISYRKLWGTSIDPASILAVRWKSTILTMQLIISTLISLKFTIESSKPKGGKVHYKNSSAKGINLYYLMVKIHHWVVLQRFLCYFFFPKHFFFNFLMLLGGRRHISTWDIIQRSVEKLAVNGMHINYFKFRFNSQEKCP